MDIAVSSIPMLIRLPLWLIFIITIKLDDSDPVFKQRRKTINAIECNLIKFRSMKVEAEKYSATAEDEPIGRLGRFYGRLGWKRCHNSLIY